MAAETQIVKIASTSLVEIFGIFLRLGLTSFGGPVAHIGYFREEFVARRRWLDDHAYGDLVALCQFLPGPASSQVGIALGLFQRGIMGAVAAWLGFTLPSAVALVAFGLTLTHANLDSGATWLHGLKVVAVAVVAQALWGMSKTLCPDVKRMGIAVVAAVLSMTVSGVVGQIMAMLAGGLVGLFWLASGSALPHTPFPLRLSTRTSLLFLVAFVTGLVALPIAARLSNSGAVHVVDSFYRSGALVFGGGHVVLPLLRSATVSTGWVSEDLFTAGYGAAQAVPGPLFTFAAYLGAISTRSPNGILGAGVALAAIFLPSFFLVIGVLPLWERVRGHPTLQRAMRGINAAVVGVLLAALYDPVWTSAIHSIADFALAAVAFVLLTVWKAPPWLVVALCGVLAGVGWR